MFFFLGGLSTIQAPWVLTQLTGQSYEIYACTVSPSHARATGPGSRHTLLPSMFECVVMLLSGTIVLRTFLFLCYHLC